MFVTQISCSCSSDRRCRQSNLCYTRIICMLLVMALAVSVVVTPASAADPELYYQDILIDAVYSCYDDDYLVSSAKQTPTHFFEGTTFAKFQWDARHYDRTFSSIIYTVYFSVDPGIDNIISTFHHYNGRSTVASKTQLDTYYYQFRIDRTSNMSWPAIEFEFIKAYSGTVSILSCIGIRDYGFDLNDVSYLQSANMIKTGTAILVDEVVKQEVDVSLPVGHMSKRTDKYQTWYYDNVYITGDFDGASSLDSLTFFGYGFVPDTPTFTILDKNEWPIHGPDFSDVGARISTWIPAWGEHAWEVYYWQIDVDLSGYDLKDCSWELNFHVEPLIYQSGMSFTDWHIERIVARLPVENTPWYKSFFSWLSVKWDNVTSSIVTEIKNVGKKLDNIVVSPVVQEQLNDAAESMDNKTEQINDFNDRFQDVERPDVTGSDLLDPIIGHNQLGLAILTSFTSQEIVGRLILAVFSFSIMGYVFFGKR